MRVVEWRLGECVIESYAWCRLIQRIGLSVKVPIAMAQWPLIVVRDAEVAKMDWLMNHERIHFAQQKETLVFGLMVLTLLEDVFARVILKKTKAEAYYWRATEQEAYLNQHDMDYLKRRKPWSVFWYVKNKRRFKGTGVPGEISFY